jgi:hypothetical protein
VKHCLLKTSKSLQTTLAAEAAGQFLIVGQTKKRGIIIILFANFFQTMDNEEDSG